tara:strand:- start:6997 stop:7374 length:378 start_codon:yes stop_codon:yes gene_type:complete
MPANLQVLTITFNGGLNESLQIGDIAYYSPLSTVASSGFSTVTTGNIIKLGNVTNINKLTSEVSIIVDTNSINIPSLGDYVMFEKDKRVNSSSLIGYYADVNFVNYSTEKIELFSIGSDFVESSK